MRPVPTARAWAFRTTYSNHKLEVTSRILPLNGTTPQ